MQLFPPINPKFPFFLHGGDYNPDQWLDHPEVIEEDFRLMKLAKVNSATVGIFAWTALEPEEGKYDFNWLDDIMDRMARQKMAAVLATPSGARPAWMAQKYPEVLRVNWDRNRIKFSMRHNHCYTSPVYRAKVRAINEKLAERYKNHPALAVWHLSNEYNGECHCDLCQEAFRAWLKKRYANDLDKLNQAWWNSFWSHQYTDWSQIESPCAFGEVNSHALKLNWKRFVTHQSLDFMKAEIAPLRSHTPRVPITSNFMGTYPGLDYWKFRDHLDVMAWDSYPQWHDTDKLWEEAITVGFTHDILRSMKKGKPFMLMESTPSATNWQALAKLKKPGVHRIASLQAVAHGADTVQYFQWRKGRGSSEKFHGAVVDHVGHEFTRVFKDVSEVGAALEKLKPVLGAGTASQVGILFDWENRWILEDIQGYRRDSLNSETTCREHYRHFWQMGVAADIIDSGEDFSRYKLLIAPMLYMLKPGVAARMEAFVKAGGTLVMTYLSGLADQDDLCFTGGFPGPLKKLFGIWVEETDCLYDHESNELKVGGLKGMKASYKTGIFCDLIHARGAKVLATYGKDFYAGSPAVTVNEFGKGRAFYLGTRASREFHRDFYGALAKELGLKGPLSGPLPEGVSARVRSKGKQDFMFVMNFSSKTTRVGLGKEKYLDLLSNEIRERDLKLEPFGVAVLKRRER